MPDTITEQGPHTPAPWAPDFAQTAESIYESPIAQARQGAAQASEKEQQAIARRGAAVKEAIGTYREERKPLPEPPPMPQIAPPPSRQLHDFLAPVENQPPAQTVMQMISALTTLGTGIGGLAKGDARAALASLTGAMTGWQQGQRERADRAFADWQANTDALLKNAQLQRQRYLDIMENTTLTNAEKLSDVHLAALEYGDDVMAAAAAKRDANDVIGQLMQDRTHIDSVLLRRDQMAQSYELRKEQMALQEKAQAAMLEMRRQELAERRREADQRHQERVREFDARMQGDEHTFTPESLKFAAEQYYLTGNLPPMGMGKASTEARIKIINMAAEMAGQAGTTGADLAARSQFYKGSQNALNTNMRQQAQLGSFIATANKNIELAKALSAKVDRDTGLPIVDKWIQAGRRAIAGDANVTNFDLINASVAAEFARVMNSATGGGVSTVDARRHAAELLNTAMTKEQYTQALDTIHAEMKNRAESFVETTNALQQAVKQGSVGIGTVAPTRQAPPRPGMVRVRRKSDGQTGWLEKKDLGDLYEIIE